MGVNKLIDLYLSMKERVVNAGYAWEIDWQASRDFEKVTERSFLVDLAWVILCSGMRVEVIRNKWSEIQGAFLNFESADFVLKRRASCRKVALRVFGSERKIDAILDGAERVRQIGWEELKARIAKDPFVELEKFKMIGPVTKFHLAKNMGIDVSKPDRHLVRMAKAIGIKNSTKLCEKISKGVGDKVSVVDIVLWRFAVLCPNYEEFIKRKMA